VLPCVAVCCRVLQWVTVCCSASKRRLRLVVELCCSVLQCVVVWCNALHCVAVCCRVLYCVAVCCSALQCDAVPLHGVSVLLWRCVAVCCRVLQCVAVLQRVVYPDSFTCVCVTCWGYILQKWLIHGSTIAHSTYGNTHTHTKEFLCMSHSTVDSFKSVP